MSRVSALVLVAVFCLTGASPADQMAAAIEKCQKAQGIPDVRSVVNAESMTLKDVSNEAGRCYVECLMREFGILDGNTLVKDKVLQEANDMIQFARSKGREVDENQVKTALSECGNQDGDGKCMKTYKMWACMNDVARQYGQLR